MQSRSAPLVSLVIANWNRKDDLRETLHRYRQQTYENVEVIVVDNGSSDGSVDMVQKEFPHVNLIKLAQNLGVEAYNIGMRNARGEIIVVSDNDSFLEKRGIEKIVAKFKRFSNLAVVACEVIHYNKNRIYQWYLHPVDRLSPPEEGYESYLFIGAGAGIRKSVLEEVGYYPEEFFMFMHEVDLCTRIINAGYEIRYFPDIITYHKGSKTTRSRDLIHYYSFRNIIWYYWKYFPMSVALGRTVLRSSFEIATGLILGTSPLCLLRAAVAAISGIPGILRKRNKIDKKYVKKALGYLSEIKTLTLSTKLWLNTKRLNSPKS